VKLLVHADRRITSSERRMTTMTNAATHSMQLSGRRVSNPRKPPGWEPGALPTELLPR
jgi:hypothetical protein